MLQLQRRLHGTVYLTMSVTAKVMLIFDLNSKLPILTLHLMTIIICSLYYNYTLYGASEIRMGTP